MKINGLYKSHLHAACCAFTAAIFILVGSFSASAFTPGDVTTCYNAWQTTFSSSWGGVWWQGPEEIEMAEDYGNVADINTMCNHFISVRGSDWSGNTANDDVMWAVIAFVRAYNATGNTTYRTYAKNGFDMVYARGWDTTAGGMWWNTTKDYKASCINFPAAIAAKLLSVALGDSSYATKSQNIYNWGKTNLWNSSNGQVSDGLHPPSSVDWTSYSYNQGTFIGAAYYNGDSSSVTLAGNYAKNTWGVTLPVYATGGGDAGGFNGIFVRWLATSGYDPVWRQAIANNAWGKRNSNHLVNNQWDRITPNTSQNDWDCSDIVVAMATVTPDGGYYKIKNVKSGTDLSCFGAGTANNTPLIIYSDVSALDQYWQIFDQGNGYYKIQNFKSGGLVSCLSGGTAKGTTNVIYQDLSASDQYWQIASGTSGGLKLINQKSGRTLSCNNGTTTNNTLIHLWDYLGGYPDQDWNFVPVTPPTNGYNPNVNYKIMNLNSCTALSCYGGGTTNNTALILYNYISAADQYWQVLDQGNGYVKIKNGKSGSLASCLGGGTANGTANIIYQDLSATDQYWQIATGTLGGLKLINQRSGRALSCNNGTTTNNTIIQLWDYLGGYPDQEWVIEPAN
jgi:hypothetical protein